MAAFQHKLQGSNVVAGNMISEKACRTLLKRFTGLPTGRCLENVILVRLNWCGQVADSQVPFNLIFSTVFIQLDWVCECMF